MSRTLDVLSCRGCGAPVPLGDGDAATCLRCQTVVPLSRDYRALRDAERAKSATNIAARGLYRQLGEPPGRIAQLWSAVPLGWIYFFFWPLAFVFVALFVAVQVDRLAPLLGGKAIDILSQTEYFGAAETDWLLLPRIVGRVHIGDALRPHAVKLHRGVMVFSRIGEQRKHGGDQDRRGGEFLIPADRNNNSSFRPLNVRRLRRRLARGSAEGAEWRNLGRTSNDVPCNRTLVRTRSLDVRRSQRRHARDDDDYFGLLVLFMAFLRWNDEPGFSAS